MADNSKNQKKSGEMKSLVGLGLVTSKQYDRVAQYLSQLKAEEQIEEPAQGQVEEPVQGQMVLAQGQHEASSEEANLYQEESKKLNSSLYANGSQGNSNTNSPQSSQPKSEFTENKNFINKKQADQVLQDKQFLSNIKKQLQEEQIKKIQDEIDEKQKQWDEEKKQLENEKADLQRQYNEVAQQLYLVQSNQNQVAQQSQLAQSNQNEDALEQRVNQMVQQQMAAIQTSNQEKFAEMEQLIQKLSAKVAINENKGKDDQDKDKSDGN